MRTVLLFNAINGRFVKWCEMKVIGNIWDKSKDAKPKETDNIIYRDFTKKGRE